MTKQNLKCPDCGGKLYALTTHMKKTTQGVSEFRYCPAEKKMVKIKCEVQG